MVETTKGTTGIARFFYGVPVNDIKRKQRYVQSFHVETFRRGTIKPKMFMVLAFGGGVVLFQTVLGMKDLLFNNNRMDLVWK